jgi:hypothetical protein
VCMFIGHEFAVNLFLLMRKALNCEIFLHPRLFRRFYGRMLFGVN